MKRLTAILVLCLLTVKAAADDPPVPTVLLRLAGKETDPATIDYDKLPVLNPNLGRRQLHLSISADGATFTCLARLDIPSTMPATLQYPHANEQNGQLLIAFSRNKNQTEVVRVSLNDIEELKRTES